VQSSAEPFDMTYELCALTDFITQYGSGASLTDIKLTDLYNYLRNPYKYIKQLRLASKYLTNKHGIVKDVLKAFKSLPTLNYHLAWSSLENPKQIKKYEQKIHDFLEEINVKKFVRDGLYESGEVGTVVSCLRKGKYIQFLDLDDIRINKQENGKWIVEYDLSVIKGNLPTNANTYDLAAVIEVLPDEVTTSAYLQFVKKGESFRYVRLKNCDVTAIDNNRNTPYGLPLSLGAWTSLIQKEIISRVERSQADQLTKKLLILYAGNIGGKDNGKPAPKPLIEGYFKEVSNLIVKKEQNQSKNPSDASGTGVIALPDFFKLEGLDVKVEMFTDDLYKKINADIFMNLGVSEALIYGSGANYSSASMNSEKFFRYIYTSIEEFERVINSYVKSMLPFGLSCKFYFDRTTLLDKDKYIDKCKDFYMQTGIFSPWAESLLGIPFQYALGLAQYEQEVLKISELIKPPQNAFTQSGSESGGRPEDTSGKSENTNKSKSSGGNKSPSPSD
jgi:hypothetical protein